MKLITILGFAALLVFAAACSDNDSTSSAPKPYEGYYDVYRTTENDAVPYSNKTRTADVWIIQEGDIVHAMFIHPYGNDEMPEYQYIWNGTVQDDGRVRMVSRPMDILTGDYDVTEVFYMEFDEDYNTFETGHYPFKDHVSADTATRWFSGTRVK